jgi:hypothetical protein
VDVVTDHITVVFGLEVIVTSVLKSLTDLQACVDKVMPAKLDLVAWLTTQFDVMSQSGEKRTDGLDNGRKIDRHRTIPYARAEPGSARIGERDAGSASGLAVCNPPGHPAVP